MKSLYESSLHSPLILIEMQEDGLFDHLAEAHLDDSVEALTQEIAYDIFKACIGPGTQNPNQLVFDLQTCNLILDRLEQIYRPRTKTTEVNPHIGYIYVIERPYPMRAEGEDKHILWVGTSERPWIAFQRATRGLGSRQLVKLMQELQKYSLERGYHNFVWRKEEIVEAYKQGLEMAVHPIDQEMLWLPWYIVDDNFQSQNSSQYHIELYKSQGHPLRNRKIGRPLKWPRE